MNRYLEKIAKEKLEQPDYGRAAAKGILYGSGLGASAAAATHLVKKPGWALVGSALGAGFGLKQGIHSSLKNQLREQELHNIKLQSAAQRTEAHEARMAKMASRSGNWVSDETKKDAITLGAIGTLGGVGSLAAAKLAPKLGPRHSNMKLFAMGTGLGLAGDYAGLQLSKGLNQDMSKSAELLEKIALNAMAKRMQDPSRPNLSMSSEHPNLDSMQAATNARAKVLEKGRGAGNAQAAYVHAHSNAAARVSSGNLARMVDSGGKDRLATTSIKDRLAEHRAKLGLSSPNGVPARQIDNALKLREARQSGAIGGEITRAGSGMAGSENAQAMNKAMLDAKNGHRAHLGIDTRINKVNMSSAAPAAKFETPKLSLLDKAKSLLKSPMGKKVAIGAGALGLGAIALKSRASNEPEYPRYA